MITPSRAPLSPFLRPYPLLFFSPIDLFPQFYTGGPLWFSPPVSVRPVHRIHPPFRRQILNQADSSPFSQKEIDGPAGIFSHAFGLAILYPLIMRLLTSLPANPWRSMLSRPRCSSQFGYVPCLSLFLFQFRFPTHSACFFLFRGETHLVL